MHIFADCHLGINIALFTSDVQMVRARLNNVGGGTGSCFFFTVYLGLRKTFGAEASTRIFFGINAQGWLLKR